MKAAILVLALALLAGCSFDDPKSAPKSIAVSPSSPLPDLTGGKPFIAGNCVEDAKTAYAILAKLGAQPRLLQIDYMGPRPNSKTNDTAYGHVLTIFRWDAGISAFDRTSGRVIIPKTVNASDAKALGTFLFWTCYLAAWTTPQTAHI